LSAARVFGDALQAARTIGNLSDDVARRTGKRKGVARMLAAIPKRQFAATKRFVTARS
jgi:hypothetical protein